MDRINEYIMDKVNTQPSVCHIKMSRFYLISEETNDLIDAINSVFKSVVKTFIGKAIDISNSTYYDVEVRKKAFRAGCKLREVTKLEDVTKLKVEILSEVIKSFREAIPLDRDRKENVNMFYKAGCALRDAGRDLPKASCALRGTVYFNLFGEGGWLSDSLRCVFREAIMLEDNIKEKVRLLSEAGFIRRSGWNYVEKPTQILPVYISFARQKEKVEFVKESVESVDVFLDAAKLEINSKEKAELLRDAGSALKDAQLLSKAQEVYKGAGDAFKDAAKSEINSKEKAQLLRDAGSAFTYADLLPEAKKAYKEAGDAFRDAAKSEINSKEKAGLLRDAGSAFKDAQLLSKAQEVYKGAGDAFKDAANSESNTSEKSYMFLEASLFFGSAEYLERDSIKKKELLSRSIEARKQMVRSCMDGINLESDKQEKFRLLNGLAEDVIMYGESEIDDRKRSNIHHEAGCFLKKAALDFEEGSKERPVILSHAMKAFYEAATYNLKEYDSLFSEAIDVCEAVVALDSVSKRKHCARSRTLFDIGDYFVEASGGEEGSKETRLLDYAKKYFIHAGDSFIAAARLESDPRKRTLMYYSGGESFIQAFEVGRKNEEKIELLSKAGSAFADAAYAERSNQETSSTCDDEEFLLKTSYEPKIGTRGRAAKLFHKAGSTFIDAYNLKRGNQDQPHRLSYQKKRGSVGIGLIGSVIKQVVPLPDDDIDGLPKERSDLLSLAEKAFENSAFAFIKAGKLESDSQKKVELLYDALFFVGISFDLKIENQEKFQILDRAGEAFIEAASGFEGDPKKKAHILSNAMSNFIDGAKFASNQETIDNLCCKAEVAFRDILKLCDDNPKENYTLSYMLYNIGLFFLEDRNFKVCIRNELLDHAKEAFRYAGRAFRDAVEFESDIKKQALLYYGAGNSFMEACKLETVNQEKAKLSYKAGYAFRYAANLDIEDREESVSCRFPKTIFFDYKENPSRDGCIHNAEIYHGEEIPLKLTFELDIGSNKKAKLLYKAGYALNLSAALYQEEKAVLFKTRLLRDAGYAFMDSAKLKEDEKEKARISYDAGYALIGAASIEDDPQKRAKLLHDAGYALRDFANLEEDEKEKARISYDAGYAFMEAAHLEKDPKEKCKLLSLAGYSLSISLTNSKIPKNASILSDGAMAFREAADLEEDKEKKGDIIYELGSVFVDLAHLENTEGKKCNLFSKAADAFMDSANLKEDKEEKARILYDAGCAFREAANLVERDPKEKCNLFSKAAYVFIDSAKLKEDKKEKARISYDIGYAFREAANLVEGDPKEKGNLLSLAGNFLLQSARNRDAEENVQVLSDGAMALREAADLKEDKEKKSTLFYKAGLAFEEAANLVEGDLKEKVRLLSLSADSLCKSANNSSNIENKVYLLRCAADASREAYSLEKDPEKKKSLLEFLANILGRAAKLECDHEKKFHTFYEQGVTFEDIVNLYTHTEAERVVLFSKAGEAFKCAFDSYKYSKEMDWVLLSKARVNMCKYFMEAAKLEGDFREKVKLFSKVGYASRDFADVERDEREKAGLLSKAGDAFKYAADLERDPEEKRKLLFLSGKSLVSASILNENLKEKSDLLNRAKIDFREVIDMGGDATEQAQILYDAVDNFIRAVHLNMYKEKNHNELKAAYELFERAADLERDKVEIDRMFSIARSLLSLIKN